MAEMSREQSRPPAHGLSARDSGSFRDATFFLAIAFVAVALAVMLAVRH